MTTKTRGGFFGSSSVELSEEDILAAMKSIHGYLDITPSDFKEVYGIAFRHAIERLSNMVKAGDIMTPGVISVGPDTPLSETAQKMEEANISGVPVVAGDRTVLGMISEKDFLWKMGAGKTGSFMGVVSECLSNRGCVAMPIRGKTAGDIMVSPVITAQRDATVFELSKKLAEHHINRIPVTDEQGRLVGIVSRGDIVDSYCAKIF